MMQPSTTPVPNALFDYYLGDLKLAELKVLLVIIRQTLGWKDKNGRFGRKENDWISGRQIARKTGCSRRAISSAVEGLADKNLIEIFDEKGNALKSPGMRQGKTVLIYSLKSTVYNPVENQMKSPGTCENITEDISKKVTTLAQKMRITKETQQN
jgi:biotin operon repressor